MPGGRAKPLNAAQRAALPLHLTDLLRLLKHDAGTRDCPRFPPAVVGATTWAPLAAAACARIADYAQATQERCGAYDEWGGLEGDIVVYQRPGGALAASFTLLLGLVFGPRRGRRGVSESAVTAMA